ncbi:alkaline phosphatase D family protein [Pontivivens nitratireducens]|uniref:Alkaline phosphatase family protein n=1 Tax=Pontivivens nitratireducens TaxID=2758038 RepID=A0A6G7VIE7_9RHOB|nr:alkaline phosphatase D family protein [Pontibrevibacter nitratireducens]QIK39618.1 alkaline phosphatase family protein [Pontibrevibacter nitratireducens]
MTRTPLAGPILFARDVDRVRYQISVILVHEDGGPLPEIAAEGDDPAQVEILWSGHGRVIYRADLTLPVASKTSYRVDETSYQVCTDLTGDANIAYVSCNGEEDEDADWPVEHRDALWSRLARDHEATPFGLFLHGGDQIYADDILASHPKIVEWEEAEPEEKSTFEWTDDMQQKAEKHLLNRYIDLYAHPAIAHMLARVPSVMMWDDHDIFDGYGSHPAPKQNSPVGQGLFEIAQRMFNLFQRGAAENIAPVGAGVKLDAPGFSVIAPDLRTARTPERVMNDAGWEWFDQVMLKRRDGNHCLVMSSVPALGPRLSWVEFMIDTFWPGVNQYEDDLRDQWQSRAHREEWKRFLGIMVREVEQNDQPVTLLSGEIHVATRATMKLKSGSVIHQLVSSGISHTPPGTGYARTLGALAIFGEDPLSGYPITIRPPAGQRNRYVSQRNYLRIRRRGEDWTAEWEFEDDGASPPLALS